MDKQNAYEKTLQSLANKSCVKEAQNEINSAIENGNFSCSIYDIAGDDREFVITYFRERGYEVTMNQYSGKIGISWSNNE
jgi:hypothetical protein